MQVNNNKSEQPCALTNQKNNMWLYLEDGCYQDNDKFSFPNLSDN